MYKAPLSARSWRAKRVCFFFALFVGAWGVVPMPLFGQTAADSAHIVEMLAMPLAVSDPHGSEMTAIASLFIGAPYVGGTLEGDTVESLKINLHAFDCTTFVETVLALVRTRSFGQRTVEAYAAQLRNIRYRGGIIDGYLSRLHYFSEWIADNERRGSVVEVSRQAGGVCDTLHLSFMSSHADLYPKLAGDPQQRARIRAQERRLSGTTFYYIPASRIDTATLAAIHDGDIIAFTTAIAGLDIAHVGIACRRDGEVHLLHASSSAGRVLLDPRPLAQQLQETRRFTGIRIIRPCLRENPIK